MEEVSRTTSKPRDLSNLDGTIVRAGSQNSARRSTEFQKENILSQNTGSCQTTHKLVPRLPSTNQEAQENFRRLFQTPDSKKISPDALHLALKTFRKNFSTISKTFFKSNQLPTPYFRAQGSRPLHFSSCGTYLSYFSKSEFIKLNLKTSQVVRRSPISRGDLSPLFVDYKIWSADDSRVLVMRSREITHNLTGEIYIYNVRTGEYKEISSDLRKKFRVNSKNTRVVLECFNPLNSHQIIVRILKKIDDTSNYRNIDFKENLVSWNYMVNSSRPFCFDIYPSGFSILPLGQFIVVLNQADSGSNDADISISYMTFYHAKAYRKVLTMKTDQPQHDSRNRYDSYSIQSNSAYSLYAMSVDQKRYKICVKSDLSAFLLLMFYLGSSI